MDNGESHQASLKEIHRLPLIEQFKLHPIHCDMATIDMLLGITYHIRESMVQELRSVAEMIAQFPIIAERDEANNVIIFPVQLYTRNNL